MSQLLSQNATLTEDGIGVYTATEIARQPENWIKVWEKVNSERKEIILFLGEVLNRNNLNIVLTGAGSSAFIGDVVSSAWLSACSSCTQAIPTTDLVTHFEQKIPKQEPLLLISFARSGNSPESTATIDIANKLCKDVYHLIITCNPNGRLAQQGKRDNTYLFLLPEDSEDKSLAMTNSFTSMALAATLIPKLLDTDTAIIRQQVQKMAVYGEKILTEFTDALYEASQMRFNRIIFLGSGPLLGIARESHLKVQELTNGQVVGKFDSFLGFRHGPKAIINDQTLLIYLLSNNESVLPYEKDLIDQISEHDINIKTLAISEDNTVDSDVKTWIRLNEKYELKEEYWAIICTLPAQIIGFYKSLSLSCNPDNPSPDGTISRVVEGVKIYN